MIAAMSGCALQANYSSPAMEVPKQWLEGQGATRTAELDRPFPDKTSLSSVANASLGIGYEIDVFGRVRESVRAAENRLAARAAEVQSARLTLVAQVADGVVALRACAFSRRVRALDIESRMQVLDLTRRRVVAGVDARVEESRARNSLAGARTEAALLNQECERQSHALHALTGLGSVEVLSIVLGPGVLSRT
jgi:outer membrane protein TolC